MAMGIVADELPHSCVEPFLKYIKDNHQGSAQLFQTFTGGPVTNRIKAEEQENSVNGASNFSNVSNSTSAAAGYDKKRSNVAE